MYVKTSDGRSVRLGLVDEAILNEDGKTVRLILSKGGERQAGVDDWYEAASLRSIGYIPAEPGTYKLHCSRFGIGEFWDCRVSVIGWIVDEQGIAEPVTPVGPIEGPYAVLMPDGTVHERCGSYDSFNTWRDEMRELHRFPPSVSAEAALVESGG